MPGVQVPGYEQIAHLLTGKDWEDYRPDFVYITTDRNLAYDFAVLQFELDEAAALYRVVPLTKPTHDPDFPPGISFRCAAARVVAVEPELFSASTKVSGAAIGYATWDDHSPLYDPDGYALPNKLQRHFGVTPEHLRHLGYAANFEDIRRRCQQVLKSLNPGITQADFDRYLRQR